VVRGRETNHAVRELELSAVLPDLQGGERGWRLNSITDDLINCAHRIKLQ